ncbi:hypothetical protein OROMI_017748 [Orobanche minor]
MGSMSYQLLIGQINTVKSSIRGPYHLKGNIIAFLTWIYEVIPSIGVKFGGRMEQEKRPRMSRYMYSMTNDFPEYPSNVELISALEPSERELNTDYWKSRGATSTANAQLLPPNILVDPDREVLIKETEDYVGEIAVKRARIKVEALPRIHKDKMIAVVGEYVVGRLAAMEHTLNAMPQAPAREATEQPITSVAEAMEGEANADGITIPTIEKFSKVTPPAQGILPGAVRATGAVEQPTIRKATRQEMLDSSDTQMNAIYDEFVCLSKVTPSAQGILPGAGGPTEVVEQPTTDIKNSIATYDDITPPAQSILPSAVGSARHAPTMAAPLRTPTALAIPKVILNVRPVRRRFPASAVRSPFLHDDICVGDTFYHYLHLEDGEMK